MQDLLSIFKELPQPEQGDVQSFTANHLEGTSHRIGKDISGWPVLLLSTTPGQGPQIHLEHLEIQHSARCRIVSNGKAEEGIFTVIRCTDASEELVNYFFRSLDPVLRTLGASPTWTEVSSAITHLVELFRALVQPPIKSVSGLWAELFVIRNARNPIELLNAWHSTPEEKFDFSSNTQRIEVKGTSRRERVHHFSLEQLAPPKGSQVIIVSLFIDKCSVGTSLSDLIQKIKNLLAVNPGLEEKLDRVVAQTLGNSLRQSMASCFDYQLAQDSLRIFDARSIPKISEILPVGVSEVHFNADLTQCEPLPKQKLLDMEGIFKSLAE